MADLKLSPFLTKGQVVKPMQDVSSLMQKHFYLSGCPMYFFFELLYQEPGLPTYLNTLLNHIASCLSLLYILRSFFQSIDLRCLMIYKLRRFVATSQDTRELWATGVLLYCFS